MFVLIFVMDILECVKKRRSVRQYKTDDVSDDVVLSLIDGARYAPSSHNCQSWEFIVVRNLDTKEKLSNLHRWAGFVKTAPVVIVVCYNTEINKNVPSNIITPAIATENLLLMATSYGLGACWVYIKDFVEIDVEKKAKEILNVPLGFDVLCMVPMGYLLNDVPQKKLRSVDDMVHFDKW